MRFHTIFFIIFLSFILITVIDGKSVRNRIYGGSRAKIGEFPYMVSLRRDGKHDCGGALITTKHVLTAYHCILGGYINLTAVVGTNSLTRGGDVYYIKKVLIYPPYDNHIIKRTFDHDIAVLTLEREVKLSHLVSTIPLPSSLVKSGVTVQLAGWGDDYTQQNSKFLQKLSVTTVYNTVCRTYYRKYGYEYLVRNQTVCTIRGFAYGACFGDSGSPLVYKGTIVGVLSVGFDQCATGIPDLYESVYYYHDFIRYAINH